MKEIALVQNHQSDYAIIIPVDCSPVEQTAAEELQSYLSKAFNVTLPIQTEGEIAGKCIYIGHTNYAKSKEVSGKSKENWIIKLVEENLILTGGVEANDRGIIYAVYHFLEDIVGVRWWNYWEEDVPAQAELYLNSDFMKEGTPKFYHRKPLHYRELDDFYFDARTRVNVVGDDGLSGGVYHPSIKKLGGAMPMGRPWHVHTLNKYYPAAEYFDKHPEWFAWSNVHGKHIPYGHYCLSNQGFIDAMIEALLKYIEEDQRLAEEFGVELPDFYSMSLPDASPDTFCQCETCQSIIKKSGYSGYALNFVNKIARAVGEKYPDVKIETLSYSKYRDKPLDDTLPEKNVIVRFANARVDLIHSILDKGNQRYLQQLSDWSEICKKAGCDLYVWEYMYNLFFALPAPIANRLGETFRMFDKLGVKGIFVENQNLSTDMWELNHYLLTHLSEDPYVDTDALIDDFMTRFYGPAAPYMKAYYAELVRASTENNYSVFCIIESAHFNYLDVQCAKRGMELLTKAVEAVGDDTVFKLRVQHTQAILGSSILLKYFDLKKSAEQMGETFDFEREAVRRMVVNGLEAYKQRSIISHGGGMHHDTIRNNMIRYFSEMVIGDEETAPLPAELSDVNPDDVYQFFFKNSCRHLHDYMNYGVSYVEDSDSATGKVQRICMYDGLNKNDSAAVYLTSKYAQHKRPITIFIEKDRNYDSGVEIYREDIVPDVYHLYKIGSVSGIKDSGDTHISIFGDNFEWVSLTGISVLFPMDACDVYLSMKFTGELYGGKKEDKDAVYLDSVVVVRK